MSESRFARLFGKTSRQFAASLCYELPNGWSVTFKAARRSDAANAKMHAMLSEIAKQVEWCGAKMSAEDWKRVATAMLKKDKFTRDVGEDGQPGNGLIVVGARTREMSNAEISEVIEWLYWFGAQHGVQFKDDAPVSIASLRK